MDADVIVVGAGPTGLMLAGELRLAGVRPLVREIARDWAPRVEIHTAKSDDRPADALLIRPDAHVAWAAPVDTAGVGLRDALDRWFGAPMKTTAPS